MDVRVTPARKPSWFRNVWTLTDLLGCPMGYVIEDTSRQFFIEPCERMHFIMKKVALGPHPSLDAALTEIEKHSPLVCRRASGQR